MEEIKNKLYGMHPSQINEKVLKDHIKLIEDYIKANPLKSCEGYEELGNIYLNFFGDVNKALFFYKCSININPDEHGNKWMLIGQIQNGKEALASFRKGIELFTAQLQTFNSSSSSSSTSSSFAAAITASSSNETREDVVGNIISALCSIADLYMSDLCFEEDAETQCETVLQQAITLCDNESETTSKAFLNKNRAQIYQTLASVRISQQRPDDAKELLYKTIGLMLPSFGKTKKDESGMNVEEDKNDKDIDEDEDDGDRMEEDEILEHDEDVGMLLPFEFRVSTVRYLIELGEVETALQILSKNLLLEDDQVVEVWILLAQCHLMRLANEDDIESAKESLDTAKELLAGLISFDPHNEMLRSQEKRVSQLEKEMKQIIKSRTGNQNGASGVHASTSASSSSKGGAQSSGKSKKKFKTKFDRKR